MCISSGGIHLNRYSWSKKALTYADPVICWIRPELFTECESGIQVGVESALGFMVCVCQEEAELTCYHFLQSGSAWGWYAVEKCQAGCEGIRSVQISLKVSTGRLTES